jgi:RNA polymerase sigma-70 factor (ECF subfamily)
MLSNSIPGEVIAHTFYKELPHAMEKEDNGALPLLKAGKREAFDELYHQWYRRICFYAYQLVREEFVAEDIALDTLTKVWEKRETFQNAQHLRRFMYQVTKNACISWLRSQMTQRKVLQSLAYLSDRADDDPDWEKLQTEIVGKVFQLIDELPDTDNRIIRLSVLEGRSHDMIARDLAITPNSVAVKKFRALTLLRSLLRQAGN